jgi:hypothetical protein
MEESYLIWLDILGFGELATEVSEKTGVTERKIRSDFIQVIKEKIETLLNRHEIKGKNYGARDDWILLVDSIDSVFKSICEILDHNTQYKKYEKIPLEIAVGLGTYDRWAKYTTKGLVIEESTVDFLKSKILGSYHNWYRQNHLGKSPTSTFIVITEEAYWKLERLDRKTCQKIEYNELSARAAGEVCTFFVADMHAFQRRGKVFEFLEKIGLPRSGLYDRIDYVYVSPVEYGEIESALEMKRIVFITGTAEYGKTYTAVRLLWEYFNKGYEPLWIAGGEESERRDVRKRLEEIEKELKARSIIYFEDPFGKTKYECREGLEREIGRILDFVSNVEDAHVVITSREEIFKEFENEQLSSVELSDFEKRLNIKRPNNYFSVEGSLVSSGRACTRALSVNECVRV